MLLMSEVLKVHTGLSIQSNVTHFTHKGCNALYVEGVERSSKCSYTSLLITLLISNRFSIQKSFGKLRLRAFKYHQILSMLEVSKVILTFDASHMHKISSKWSFTSLLIPSLIFNRFSIRKKVLKS